MIVLRAFERTDLAAAYRLDQVCFPTGIAYTQSELRYFVSRPAAFALVAECNRAHAGKPAGTMAGFLVAGHDSRKLCGAAHIVTIDVAPLARRSGVATLLMDAAELHYQQLACKAMTLEVAVDNTSAQAFYAGRGFTISGMERGYYNGVLDAFTMRKQL